MKSKVVVVSLKDAVWRRKVISTQLDSLGVEYEFFDALDYRGLDSKELLSVEEHKAYTQMLSHCWGPVASTIGNYRSLCAAMQVALDRGDESVVICEDDAFFSPAFSEVIEAIEQLDPEINLVSLGTLWEIYFGLTSRYTPASRYIDDEVNLPKGRKLFRCVTAPMGCHGFFVRRNWMEQHLAGMSFVDMPPDWKLFGAWRSHTPFWSLNMGGDIVYQGIGGDSYSGTRSFNARQPVQKFSATKRRVDYAITQYLRLFG